MEEIRADLAAYDGSHPHQTNAADVAVDDIRILLVLVDQLVADKRRQAEHLEHMQRQRRNEKTNARHHRKEVDRDTKALALARNEARQVIWQLVEQVNEEPRCPFCHAAENTDTERIDHYGTCPMVPLVALTTTEEESGDR